MPEDQLAYGFKKKPLDQQTIKNYPDIPEEKLYNVNPQIIEFKKPSFNSEEEEEDEDDEEGFENKKQCTKTFGSTYTDLGYREVIPMDRKYYNVPISTTPMPRVYLPYECSGRVVEVSSESENDYRPAELAEKCPIHEFSLTR